MITQDNIFKHELIGLQATITNSSNSQLIGTSGLVIDETKSTLVLNTKQGTKSIPKNINEWKFSTSTQDISINGSKITKRSAERLMIKA